MNSSGLQQNYLVLTVVIGQEAEELYTLSQNSIQAYAQRLGADFKCIRENVFTADVPLHYNKLQIQNFLESYQRILYVDCDVIISPDTPNIFDVVPEDAIGVLKESDLYNRTENIREVQQVFGRVPGWQTDYFNAGVMVVSQLHRDLFERPEKFFSDAFYEQTYLNWKAHSLNYKIHYFAPKFNWIFSRAAGQVSPNSGYIVHFAGWGFQQPKNQNDHKHPYKYHQMKCFLDYLEGHTTFRIHPQQLSIISGQIKPDSSFWNMLNPAGNKGLISYGPYLTIPGGAYKVSIDFEFYLDARLQNLGKNQQAIALKFDIASNAGNYTWKSYNVKVCQEKFEFLIDFVDIKDLEFRFYATGITFALKLIELCLLESSESLRQKTAEWEPDLNIQTKTKHSTYNSPTLPKNSLNQASSRQQEQPRILLESFPLTLKQGTGIYTYSINLLQALNELSLSEIGLLLLFEAPIKKLKKRNSKKSYVQLSFYAHLLSRLSQSRATNSTYQKLRNATPISRLNYRNFYNCLSISVDYVKILSSFFKGLDLICLPDYMKSSLLEVLLDGESISYDFLSENIPYIVDSQRHNLLVRNMFNIKNIINSRELNNNYDVFHCTHLSPLAVVAMPRVTTIHDIIPLLRPELSKDNRLLFSKLLEFNIQQSTQIIAVSETTKRDIIDCCQVPPEKVTVIYEAASPDLCPATYSESAAILRSINLLDTSGKPEPYFLFIGNIEPKKNVKRLLQAFQQFLLADKVGYKLVIVGAPAWGYDSVKSLLHEMVEYQAVILTGYLPTYYLPALLSHARAFIFPSLTEGFGLPVLEAMACGCPVITSNAPSITEVCGDAALQVNPQSVAEICRAMTQIASDNELCSQLREKGLQRNQLFSWEKCAKETLEVYQEACRDYYLSGSKSQKGLC